MGNMLFNRRLGTASDEDGGEVDMTIIYIIYTYILYIFILDDRVIKKEKRIGGQAIYILLPMISFPGIGAGCNTS